MDFRDKRLMQSGIDLIDYNEPLITHSIEDDIDEAIWPEEMNKNILNPLEEKQTSYGQYLFVGLSAVAAAGAYAIFRYYIR